MTGTLDDMTLTSLMLITTTTTSTKRNCILKSTC